MTRRRALSFANLLWLAAYFVVVVGIVVGLFALRDWALTTYGTEAEEANWQSWRETAAEQQTGEGSVLRSPPKSTKPPAVVLMSDYFAVCLVGALVVSTALFATFMLLSRGAFARSTMPRIE